MVGNAEITLDLDARGSLGSLANDVIGKIAASTYVSDFLRLRHS
jgi:hypothetical protein